MKSGWHWPVILAGLMGIALVANFTLLFLASSDPSFAVEPDYYDKAVHWDDKRAQDIHNAELGWDLEFDIAPGPDAAGRRRLRVMLVDRAGLPVRGAAVRVEAFHNARATLVLDDRLRPTDDGAYEASLPLRKAGVWEFRFEAVLGDDRFTGTMLRDVAPAR